MTSWIEIKYTSQENVKGFAAHSVVSFLDTIFIFSSSQDDENLNIYTLANHDLMKIDYKATIEVLSPPKSRIYFSAVRYGDGIYFFGGQSNGENLNDMYKFEFSQYWKKITPNNPPPPPRCGHSAITYYFMMIVFGGMRNDGACNDTFIYDLVNHKWQLALFKGNTPSERYFHSACLVEDQMYIFGGSNDDGLTFNDFYALNLLSNTWNEIQQNGDIPSKRMLHSMVEFDENIFLFGGCNEKSETLNDLYMFDTENKMWKKLEYLNAPNRCSHAMCVIENNLYLIGGLEAADQPKNDIYCIELPKSEKPKGIIPMVSPLSKMLLNSSTDVIFLVENNRIACHKSIMSFCDEFAKLIESSKDKIPIIEINDIPFLVFQKILEYLYNGSFLLTMKDSKILVNLFQISEKLNLKEIQNLCIFQFGQVAHFDTIWDIIIDSHKLKCETIKQLGFNYLHANQSKLQKFPDYVIQEYSILMLEFMKQKEPKHIKFEPIKDEMQSLKEKINKLFETKKFFDVILVSKNGIKFECHRVILMAFCKYFEKLEETEKEISLNVDDKTLKWILEYIYLMNPALPEKEEDLKSLLNGAKELYLDNLVQILNK